MKGDLSEMTQALDLSGEPDPRALVQKLIELRQQLRDRNKWCAALLREVSRPRLNPFPRSLREHEAGFLKEHDSRDNGSKS